MRWFVHMLNSNYYNYFLKYEILNQISSLLSIALLQLKGTSPQKLERSYFAFFSFFCTVFFYLITLMFSHLITCHCWAAQLARFLSSAACRSLNSLPLIRKQEIITLAWHKTLQLQAAATLDRFACIDTLQEQGNASCPEVLKRHKYLNEHVCVYMHACLCL